MNISVGKVLVGTLAVFGGFTLWGAVRRAAVTPIAARAGRTYTPPGNTLQDQIAFCKGGHADPVIARNCLTWIREVGVQI